MNSHSNKNERITERMNEPTKKQVLSVLLILLICFFSSVFCCAASTIPAATLQAVTITDSASKNSPPTAVINYTQVGDVYNFDASGSNDSGGTIAEYKWDFGDGTTGSGVTTSHVYTKEISFPVTLTVTDNGGAVALTQNIIVNSTIVVEQLSTGGNTDNIRLQRAVGQGFYLPVATKLHSIIIKTGSKGYGSPPMKIRVGTTRDLSTSYMGESAEIVTSKANTEYEFIFNPSISLEANTQYYFVVSCTNDKSYNFIDFVRATTNAYDPKGCSDCNRMYNYGVAKWNANKITYDTDLFFKVKRQ